MFTRSITPVAAQCRQTELLAEASHERWIVAAERAAACSATLVGEGVVRCLLPRTLRVFSARLVPRSQFSRIHAAHRTAWAE